MDAASAITCLAVAIVFFWSGIGKLRAIASSGETLRALRLPEVAPRTLVSALAAGELAVAVGIVLAPPAATVAAAIGTLLAACFLAVVIRAWSLGSTDPCGCFGAGDRSVIGPALIVRNSALVVVAALATAALLTGARGFPAIFTSPVSTLPPLVAAAAVGALAASIARTHERNAAAPSLAHVPGLIDLRSGRIDLIERLVLGRAQLLVFVKPGCASCVAVLDSIDSLADELAERVDVRIVAGVRAGDTLSAALEREPRVTTVDLDDAVARSLDVTTRRPVGVLVGRDGNAVQPYAEGADQIQQLADTIAVS